MIKTHLTLTGAPGITYGSLFDHFPFSWLTPWRYRKAVTISRPSGAVSDYQMKIAVGESESAVGATVHCEGLCKSDFSDIRFTSADGTTLLDYYIEDIAGSESPNYLASIWVKFDYIGINDTTFYMYYGNTLASPVSNGPNTFIFFEDFNLLNDGDLNGQNGWSGDNRWDVITTTQYEGAKAAASTALSVSQIEHTLTHSYVHAIFLQLRMRHSQASTASGLDVYLFQDTSQVTAIAISTNTFLSLVSPPAWVDIGASASSDIWYKAFLAINSTTEHRTWIDDVQYSPANQSNMTTVTTGINKIQLEQYTAGGTAFVDQIMVGQYYPTAPSWGSWGAHEARFREWYPFPGIPSLIG